MRKLGLYLLLGGLMLGVPIIPAYAVTISVTLTGSGPNDVNFIGNGSGGAFVNLGCAVSGTTTTGAACAMTGSASGAGATSYTLQSTSGTITLANTGVGVWSASVAAQLAATTITLTNSGTVFTGTLASLSFSQSPGDLTGVVTMTGTATGNGASFGTTLSFSASIQLAPGSNINSVFAAKTPPMATNVSGSIVGGGAVPEPASMLLFGSGLVALGGALRRRKGLLR